jgi:hypothetical protein
VPKRLRPADRGYGGRLLGQPQLRHSVDHRRARTVSGEPVMERALRLRLRGGGILSKIKPKASKVRAGADMQKEIWRAKDLGLDHFFF